MKAVYKQLEIGFEPVHSQIVSRTHGLASQNLKTEMLHLTDIAACHEVVSLNLWWTTVSVRSFQQAQKLLQPIRSSRQRESALSFQIFVQQERHFGKVDMGDRCIRTLCVISTLDSLLFNGCPEVRKWLVYLHTF